MVSNLSVRLVTWRCVCLLTTQAAVDVVRRHPALAGEPSQRYARALLDRELSALLLIEAMLAAEADEATRARTAAEDNLKKHRYACRHTHTCARERVSCHSRAVASYQPA